MTQLGSGIVVGQILAGGGVSSANVGKQKFTAGAGMTGVIVTDFTLNEFIVFVDGSMQTFGYTSSGQTITFINAFLGGEEILVEGIK